MTPTELLKLLQSDAQADRVSPRTREVLLARIHTSPRKPTFFSAAELACAQAVSKCVIAHEGDWPMPDLALSLDERLTSGEGKGWRYDQLKPEREMWREGFTVIDAAAVKAHGVSFAQLPETSREDLLRHLFESSRADDWLSLFWEEVLVEFTEGYYAHPFAQAEIEALGMIDGGLPRKMHENVS